VKIGLVVLVTGDLQLEVISETDLEFWLLERAWKVNGYKRSEGGMSMEPGGTRSMGFYVPLGTLVASGPTPGESLGMTQEG
jgi:hypothetical protein